jgi:hypothetical protein
LRQGGYLFSFLFQDKLLVNKEKAKRHTQLSRKLWTGNRACSRL